MLQIFDIPNLEGNFGTGTNPKISIRRSLMEGIIREVNVAYESVKKGKEEGFDSSIFAEEHIHSVIDLVSNKSVTDALSKMVCLHKMDKLQQSSFKDSISDNQCKDDLFSIVKGSDVGILEKGLFTDQTK